MPNFLNLLLSFKGRIGRASWWLGFVLTVIGNIVGVVLFESQSKPCGAWFGTTNPLELSADGGMRLFLPAEGRRLG